MEPYTVLRMLSDNGIHAHLEEPERLVTRLAHIRQAIDDVIEHGLLPAEDQFSMDGWGEPHTRRTDEPAEQRPAAAIDSTDPTRLDMCRLSQLIERREISPVELLDAYVARIGRFDRHLNAFITLTLERAADDAQRAEAELARGDRRGPLHGLPVAHKDMLDVAGVATTNNCSYFLDNVPDVDDPCVEALVRAGTVLVGKLNTYELGNGTGGPFGPARNPWDPEREAGGSSSGSAAAMSAGLVAGSTGTDAAGSIRVPAAFCGVVGLKPTYGVVPQNRRTPSSVIVAGPITRTARDAALMLEAMAGPGDRRYCQLGNRLRDNLRGRTMGIPRKWLDVPMQEDVADAFQQVVDWFRGAGAAIRDVELPHAAWSQSACTAITTVEGFSSLRPVLTGGAATKYVLHTIALAHLISAADYLVAKRARRLLVEESQAVMREVDLILTPTVQYTAYRFDETTLDLGVPVDARANLTVFGRLANLTGMPAASLPMGFDSRGLPMAFQLMARPYAEDCLLGAAAAYEDEMNWWRIQPPLDGIPTNGNSE